MNGETINDPHRANKIAHMLTTKSAVAAMVAAAEARRAAWAAREEIAVRLHREGWSDQRISDELSRLLDEAGISTAMRSDIGISRQRITQARMESRLRGADGSR